MKTALYVAAVARTYRKAIDDCLESEELYRSHMDWYKEQIAACTYRDFTTGFSMGGLMRALRSITIIPIGKDTPIWELWAA